MQLKILSTLNAVEQSGQHIFLPIVFWCGFILLCSVPHITLLLSRVFLLKFLFFKALDHKVIHFQLQVM